MRKGSHCIVIDCANTEADENLSFLLYPLVETRRKFKYADVAKKIHMLKYQYKRCYMQMGKNDGNASSKLWCYELLHFLKDHIDLYEKKKKDHSTDKKKPYSEAHSNTDEDDCTATVAYDDVDEDDDVPLSVIKQECVTIPKEVTESKYKDSFNNVSVNTSFNRLGANVASQLRDMSDEQRLFSERLINELMYHGLMENLTAKSKLRVYEEI